MLMTKNPVDVSLTALRHRAFTRIELCAVAAVLGLLAVMAIPVVANSKDSTERALCMNNLRLIGRGVASWGGDYGQRAPWRVTQSEGGTMPDAGTKPALPWPEYYTLSNELVTPRILACPSDRGVLIASNFVHYGSVGMRGQSTSYNVHADVSPDTPRAVLSMDRNIRFDGTGSGCSARIVGFYTAPLYWAWLDWTNNVHGPDAGHLALNDGSVAFTTSRALQNLVTATASEGKFHVMVAR